MHDNSLSRRRFLQRALLLSGGATLFGHLPLWAASAQTTAFGAGARDRFDLTIGASTVPIAGQSPTALTINGTVPGPLLRFREGQPVTLNVSNALAEDTSLHWHGLILPTDMDGVPGLSFDGIGPNSQYRYHFDVRQSGTYWYHSHSGLQEQSGVYGPIIIDPAGDDPVQYDREFIVLLSDWTFEDPDRMFANLKVADDYYNPNRPTGNLTSMWSRMRMSPTDIADVSGLGYTYLLNGLDSAANWSGIFNAGERVRLRFINGSAMSFFNVRIPELEMTVVQADGQNIEPVVVDEFQIGTAETYDVVVTPAERAYTIMAESADRSGYVRGTLAPQAGMTAAVPSLREPPTLSMRDMGMSHGGHSGHRMPPLEHHHPAGPGVANLSEMAMSRLDEAGIGLEQVPHRALRYSQLRSLDRNKDTRKPGRRLEIHLTGNMHRYMWSFDGLKFSEVEGPILFRYGERLRLTLVNDTMMAHPIHLHGMFVELVNGNGDFNPRKHTVVVKPAERLQVDVTADAPGHWAFHCHLLFHMKAGMMHSVRVSDEVLT
ncbi:MAG: copper resistance system multicopper oxidase [Gammaproteobacteria bacterium]|nr:copper resistance system multicopper oxidase [Gammaproteobacteria bacterium]